MEKILLISLKLNFTLTLGCYGLRYSLDGSRKVLYLVIIFSRLRNIFSGSRPLPRRITKPYFKKTVYADSEKPFYKGSFWRIPWARMLHFELSDFLLEVTLRNNSSRIDLKSIFRICCSTGKVCLEVILTLSDQSDHLFWKHSSGISYPPRGITSFGRGIHPTKVPFNTFISQFQDSARDTFWNSLIKAVSISNESSRCVYGFRCLLQWN